jgi:DNA-binding response OmpR family regulator
MTTILVVDDDPAIREMLLPALAGAGFATQEAASTAAARHLIAAAPPDLLLLDWMLPGQSGYEFARELFMDTSLPAIPVIMLTARDQEEDKVAALEAGADDYVSKPFSISELLARIRAVLRRGRATTSTRLRVGRLEIDFDAREVTVAGRRKLLTSYEFDLLAALARAAGRVLSREQLLDALRGAQHESFDRSIDVHVSKLRAKLEADPKAPRHIKTVRGVGYVLLRDGE